MANITQNDVTYRLLSLNCYISTFSEKVAKEFINGNNNAWCDFEKLELLLMYLDVLKCYKVVNFLELENESGILLENGNCLLLE